MKYLIYEAPALELVAVTAEYGFAASNSQGGSTLPEYPEIPGGGEDL